MHVEKAQIKYLLRFLITRNATVEERLRKAQRYEEFRNEISRWKDNYLNGDRAQAMTAEALSRAADALFVIVKEFKLPYEEFVGTQRESVHGAVRTRGGAVKVSGARDNISEQLIKVAELFGRS